MATEAKIPGLQDGLGELGLGEDPVVFTALDIFDVGGDADEIIYAVELEPAYIGYAATDVSGEAVAEFALVESIEMEPILASDYIYAATRHFITTADDNPATAQFSSRLIDVGYQTSIYTGSFFGQAVLGDGSISLANQDGALDFLADQDIAGRAVRIKAGRRGIPYAEWAPVMRGTAEDFSGFGETVVSVAIRDFGYKLSVPAQTRLYLGTGGAEGGTDLEGKRKPLVLGRVVNVRPPLVDQANVIYQIHDGELDEVFAVRDRGVAFIPGDDYPDFAALVAAATVAGEFDTCLAEGFMKLGTSPAGTVTADARSLFFGTARIGDIVRGFITDRSEIDLFQTRTFNTLNELYDGVEFGIYLSETEEIDVLTVIARLLSGIGGWVGFRPDGRCYIQRFEAPAESDPVIDLDRGDIIGDAARDRLPPDLNPPPWRMRLLYEKNYTIQTDNSVTTDPKYSLPGKTATAQDTNVQAANPQARDMPPVDSYMHASSGAFAEVARQLAIYKVRRALWRFAVSRRGNIADMGDQAAMTYDRWATTFSAVAVQKELNVRVGRDAVDQVDMVVYG